MELSIAINSYRNTELLKLCLDSIKENITGISYEMIVADSATQEATAIMMREDYPEVKFFPFKKNVGFQALLKKAVEESTGIYILILNYDIIVTKGSVESLLGFIKNNPAAGIVGPQLLNFNGTLQYSCFRFYRPITIVYRRTFLRKFKFAQKHLDWFLMKDYNHRRPQEVDWIMGSAMLVSREAVKKVGLMDPQFFMYMEDVDWCRRFWEAGCKVMYFPLSKMHHYHGKGSAKKGFFYSLFFNRLTWIHIFSAVKYFKKYWGKPVPQHN
ncbi:MAG: glycosyltransferase family 2 protein [Candidatus Moranbacteria bacterium]|nr:glycosyltransferase family 2 protein [Candidatus Moranbacteria bacterium]